MTHIQSRTSQRQYLILYGWLISFLSIAYICCTAIPFYAYGVHRYTYDEILSQVPQTTYFSTIFSFIGLWTIVLLPSFGMALAGVIVFVGARYWRQMTTKEKMVAGTALVIFISTLTLYFSYPGQLMNLWMMD